MKLYLIVETADARGGFLELEGRHWGLDVFELDEKSTPHLSFLCISYTWGLGREPSPFHAGFDVSDRTIPALRSAIRMRPHFTKIWIDAFCVPQDAQERYSCLESMGFIYSQADEVVVVLSPAAQPVIRAMADTKQLDNHDLPILEKEAWVTRAWTYQEAINSRSLSFTSEGASGTPIAATGFLNCVGHALNRLQLAPLERRSTWPGLEAFEDLFDYLTSVYEERSALQIMGDMDRRTQLRPEDHFYAMMGAVSRIPASSSGTSDACEAFMRLCERKGDYSFIYSAAPRCSEPGRRWRPLSGHLPAVLQWQCGGGGQPGSVEEDGLVLSQLVTMEQGPATEAAKAFVFRWFQSLRCGEECRWADLPARILGALRLMGFTGGDAFWELPGGLFFTTSVPKSVGSFVVSASLGWRFGAPGLALSSGGSAISYNPGVFVGIVDQSTASHVKLV